MNKPANRYATPEANLAPEPEQKKQKRWIGYAVLAAIVVLMNCFLATVVLARDFPNQATLIGGVVGYVFGMPLLVLGMSQFFRQHRSGHARVKAFIYPSYVVLAVLIMELSENAARGAG